MTLDSGVGAGGARPSFETGYFTRAKRDETARAGSAAPPPPGRDERDAAARPIRRVGEPGSAPDSVARRPPGRHGGALLSLDAITQLQDESADGAEAGAPARAGALDPAQEAEVRELKAADREVRAHERAHAAAGGVHAGQPSYRYRTGPDGRRYAVAGEVAIDTSPVAGDPRATLQKADQVGRAATAPAEPSPQDRQVAAAAQALRREARAELNRQRAAESAGASPADAGSAAATAKDRDEAATAPPNTASEPLGFEAGDDGEAPFSSRQGAGGSGGPLERIRETAPGPGRPHPADRERPGLGREDPQGGIPDGTLADRTLSRARPGSAIDVRI